MRIEINFVCESCSIGAHTECEGNRHETYCDCQHKGTEVAK